MSESPMNAYCVGCKSSQPMVNPTSKVLSNGKNAMTAPCPTCGTSMFRIQSGAASPASEPVLAPPAAKPAKAKATPFTGKPSWPPMAAPIVQSSPSSAPKVPNAFKSFNMYRSPKV